MPRLCMNRVSAQSLVVSSCFLQFWGGVWKSLEFHLKRRQVRSFQVLGSSSRPVCTVKVWNSGAEEQRLLRCHVRTFLQCYLLAFCRA